VDFAGVFDEQVAHGWPVIQELPDGVFYRVMALSEQLIDEWYRSNRRQIFGERAVLAFLAAVPIRDMLAAMTDAQVVAAILEMEPGELQHWRVVYARAWGAVVWDSGSISRLVPTPHRAIQVEVIKVARRMIEAGEL